MTVSMNSVSISLTVRLPDFNACRVSLVEPIVVLDMELLLLLFFFIGGESRSIFVAPKEELFLAVEACDRLGKKL
jgi:hypothetical protein